MTASINLKKTFLHSNMEEKLYIVQSEGFKVKGKEEFVCRLKKILYELKQPPRKWYEIFYSFILENGCKKMSPVIVSTSSGLVRGLSFSYYMCMIRLS